MLEADYSDYPGNPNNPGNQNDTAAWENLPYNDDTTAQSELAK